MCPYRAKLLSVAYEQIDSNLGAYSTREAQNEILTELINQHDLKRVQQTGLSPKRTILIQLTTLHYRKLLSDITRMQGVRAPGQNETHADLFFKYGSEHHAAAWVQRTGYVRQADGGDGEESELSSDAADEDLSESEGADVSFTIFKPKARAAPASSGVEGRKCNMRASTRGTPGPGSSSVNREAGEQALIAKERDARVLKHSQPSQGAPSSRCKTVPSTSRGSTGLQQVSDTPSTIVVAGRSQQEAPTALRQMADVSDSGPTFSPLTPTDEATKNRPAKRQKVDDSEEIPSSTGSQTLHGTQESDNINIEHDEDAVRVRDQDSSLLVNVQAQEMPGPAQRGSGTIDPSSTESEKPPTKASRSFVDSLTEISAAQVSRDLTSIWSLIQSTARNILVDHGVDPDGEARLVPNPPAEIVRLYHRLFGMRYNARVMTLGRARLLQRQHLIEGCLAAEVFDVVFGTCRLPWLGPKETLARLQADEESLKEVLEEFGM